MDKKLAMQAFGGRLRFLRSLEGLTQAALAERANISLEHLNKIERGVAAPSFQVINGLAQALGSHPANLFLSVPAEESADEQARGRGPDQDEAHPTLDLPSFVGPVGCFAFSPATDELVWYPSLRRLFGLAESRPASEIVPLDRVVEQDREAVRAAAASIRAGVETRNLLFHFRHPKAGVRSAVLHCQASQSPRDEQPWIMGVVLDVSEIRRLEDHLTQERGSLQERVRQRTRSLEEAVGKLSQEVGERRRAEASLEASRQHLEHVLNALTCGICVLNAPGKVQAANRVWLQRAAELSSDTIGLGTDYLGLWRRLAEAGNPWARKLADGIAAVLDGSSQGYELEHPVPSVRAGLWIRTRVAPLAWSDGAAASSREPAQDGPGAGCVITHSDISAFRQSRQMLSGILEVITDCIVVVDADLQVVLANRPLREELGVEPGSFCYELFHNRSEPCPDCPVQEALRTGEPQSRCFQYGPTGSYVEQLAYPLRDVDGRIHLVVEHMRDVTDLRAYQLDCSLARQQAERHSSSKSAFIASLSHEIRNPLHGIMGMLQLLNISPLEGEQRFYVDIALESSQALLSIVNEILDLSRIESGRLELRRAPFSPAALVGSSLALFQAQAAAKGLALASELDPGLPEWLLGDADRIRQVLINLVGNAVKYTPSGGVTVRASSRQLAATEEGVDPVELILEVQDSGPGIAATDAERIFEPFVRENRSGDGHGLGLALVRGFCQLMGGTVQVQRGRDQGANFVVRLPLEPADASQVEQARLAQQHAQPWAGNGESAEDQGADGPQDARTADAAVCDMGRRLRVLVVEDQQIGRLLVTHMLERLGHEAVTAASAEEGLELLAAERFDCVLLDEELPGMPGSQMAVRVRSGEASPRPLDRETYLVALTAHAMPEERRAIMAAGMDDFLSKPVDAAALGRVLARCAAHSPPGDSDPGPASGD